MSSDSTPQKTDKKIDISHDQLDAMPSVLVSNRYKVLTILGDGGFGKTFLVEDTHMPSNRRCVLKQLKPTHDDIRQVVQDRFQREAAILEQLGEAHEQIPRLFAYFSEADQFYLVEEWVDGLTLTQKVAQFGPLPESAVQAILSRLLPAIAYVHSQRIVHRDIKPDNIILRAQDELPILIDFGAVKEAMATVITGQHAPSSIVVGTPGFMSIEQIAGRPTFASDVYSLGVTAVYLLTGKTPTEFPSDPRTGYLQWREHAPNISPGFANVLERAMSPDTRDRFATVADMQAALSQITPAGNADNAASIQALSNLPTVVSGPDAAWSPTQPNPSAQNPSVQPADVPTQSAPAEEAPTAFAIGTDINSHRDSRAAADHTPPSIAQTDSKKKPLMKPLLLAGGIGLCAMVAGVLFAGGFNDALGQLRQSQNGTDSGTSTQNGGGVELKIGLPANDSSEPSEETTNESADEDLQTPPETDDSTQLDKEESTSDSNEDNGENSANENNESDNSADTVVTGQMPRQANPSRYYFQWNGWEKWRVTTPAVYCTQTVDSRETTTILKANTVLTVHNNGQNPIQLDTGANPSPFLRVNGPNGPCYVGAKSTLIVPLTESEEASGFLVNNRANVPTPADSGNYNTWLNWPQWRVITPNLACLDAPKLKTGDVVATIPADTVLSVSQAPNSDLALGTEGDTRNKPYLRVNTALGACFVRASSNWIAPSVGSRIPLNKCIRVDLPEPLGPTKQTE
ncbi:MAG: protein kinase, partial [Cyanobacteria bacterium J06632_3]